MKKLDYQYLGEFIKLYSFKGEIILYSEIESDIVRSSILKSGIRIDERDTKTVRPIISEVGILPRTHGSSLFTRGETQALVVATLGTTQDEQIIDALEGPQTGLLQ